MPSSKGAYAFFTLLGKHKIATPEQIDVGAIFRKTV